MATHTRRGGLLIPLNFLISCAIVLVGVALATGSEAPLKEWWPYGLIFLLSAIACAVQAHRYPVTREKAAVHSGGSWRWASVSTNTFLELSFWAWCGVFSVLALACAAWRYLPGVI